jgi:hypothetical protein
MLQTRSARSCHLRGPDRGLWVDEIDLAACSMNTSSQRDDWVYAPYELETQLVDAYALPLNLDQNQHNRFHPELTAARKAAKELAAQLPILPR